MKKNLTKFSDLEPSEVQKIIDLAFDFKSKHARGVRKEDVLHGKVVALVFEKPSLRTKVAFEVAALCLNGTPVFLSSSQILASGQNQHGRESIPDIGRNLERFADMIVARVYSHSVITELAKSVHCPVVNALCDKHHPTQALADLVTIISHCPNGPSLKVAFIGDGNNVATSLMEMCAMRGINFSIASPEGYEIPLVEREEAIRYSQKSGIELRFLTDPKAAIQKADVVYTDTFVSMGQEGEGAKRMRDFENYQVNSKLMALAKPQAIFMHCLPAHRGEEVTDEVIDSKQSVVFDQAESRLHVAKALMVHYLEGA